MNKEEALVEFLKGLRIALNNASVYFKEHPYFRKSVEEFKKKIDELFMFLDPIKINVAPSSLFIDGKYWEKGQLFTELAAYFHLRKIKAIELRHGMSVDELIEFLTTLALAPKEIIKRGGVRHILCAGIDSHCLVDELDYSELLRDGGEGSTDVWAFMFGEALQKKDAQRIKEFVDGFEGILTKFRPKDIAENQELRTSLHDFMLYLKQEQRDKFDKCTRELFRSLLKYKDTVTTEELDVLKDFFKDLNVEDLAGMLWDGIVKDDSFDALSLQLFSRLSGDDKHKAISGSLLTKTDKKSLEGQPKVVKKIRNLLSSSDSGIMSEGYRHILSSLIKDISLEKGFSFDRRQLEKNYRYILANIFEKELDDVKLKLVLEKINKDLERAMQEKDLGYLKYLFDFSKEKSVCRQGLGYLCEELDKRIFVFFESLIWSNSLPAQVRDALAYLEKSSYEVDVYIEKIFGEQKINSTILRLFLKFFPEHEGLLYKHLERYSSDIDFLLRFINVVEELDVASAEKILKHIYSGSSSFIKPEIMRSMRRIGCKDKEFIFSILHNTDVSLRKEALLALENDIAVKLEAAQELLLLKNSWGMKNRIILENMAIIDEVGLREAEDSLTLLSKRPFFWNKNIRIKAGEILERWHARKN